MCSEQHDKSLPNTGMYKSGGGAKLLSDLRSSGIVGMWNDRKDLGHSSEFARNLRDRAYRQEDR